MASKLKILCSPYTGYCFGVKRAMRLIERGLSERGGILYTLGDVIHNPQAVARLKSRGVYPITLLDEVERGATLIIRAHGVHPDLMLEAGKRGIELIDATCPFVQRSQRYAQQLSKESYDVIIVGDSKHPEVQSISGYAGGDVLIVDTVERACRVCELAKAGVVIQTTFSRDDAMSIIGILKKRVKELRVFDTVCQATMLRREATLELAGQVDIILVIGGRGSSNTSRLYKMCIEAGFPAKFIETADEIDPAWFEGCQTVGLTTGTSTPDWIVEDVLRRMERISKNGKGGAP